MRPIVAPDPPLDRTIDDGYAWQCPIAGCPYEASRSGRAGHLLTGDHLRSVHGDRLSDHGLALRPGRPPKDGHQRQRAPMRTASSQEG